MTDNILIFRPASGTTDRDLADVRGALPPGWHAGPQADDEGAAWMGLDGPWGVAWTIGRQGGRFFAWSVLPDGREVSMGGFSTARDAALAAIRESTAAA